MNGVFVQKSLSIDRIKLKTMHLKPTLILLAALVLGACNNIAPEDRFIEVASATVKRKVLVEEFTGQRCLNCPEAANELARLQAQYGGDTLIVVAIHGGRLAAQLLRYVHHLWSQHAQPCSLQHG